MKELIFRASSVPKIMGAKGLGVTGQKEAVKQFAAQFKDRDTEIKSKYLEKGILNEVGAIELVNRVHGTNFVKNDVRMHNDYITGECDCISEDEIIDVKCSWDLNTFYNACIFDYLDYEWQLRAYMELYDRPKASVVYCLTDMPDHMLLSELNKASFPYDGDLPDFIGIRIVKRAIFDKDNFARFMELAPINRNNVIKEIDKFVHIPIEERVFKYQFHRDHTLTETMYLRIQAAREFLKVKGLIK